MSEESQEEPKLIIDEDWKTQVLREKEELKKAQEDDQEPSPESPPATGGDTGDQEASEEASASESDQAAAEAGELPPPPPASFSFLLTTLATQAMAALGQMPGEDGKPMPANLDYARHFIDLIGVLEEKTSGNLDENEQKFLQETLHQMRMMFVTISQQQGKPE